MQAVPCESDDWDTARDDRTVSQLRLASRTSAGHSDFATAFHRSWLQTAYCGKIFHRGDEDTDNSWSREPVKSVKGIKRPQGPYALPENRKLRADNFKEMYAKYGEAARRGLASGPAFEKADVPDHSYLDGYNTLLAIATIKEMVASDKPFFLGMGYKLPHLNWCAPATYWELYEPTEIPMAAETTAPERGAAMGLHASFELRTAQQYSKVRTDRRGTGPPTQTCLSRVNQLCKTHRLVCCSRHSMKRVFATTRSSSSGETTVGTSVTWVSGGRQRTTRSPHVFR